MEECVVSPHRRTLLPWLGTLPVLKTQCVLRGAYGLVGTVITTSTWEWKDTISFQDLEGREKQFTVYVGSSFVSPVGKQVRVLYNPNIPKFPLLDNWLALWGIPILGPTLVGTVFAVVGMVGSFWPQLSPFYD